MSSTRSPLGARLVGLAALALVVAPASAGADTPPSVWERAKDPSAAAVWALHVNVQERLNGADAVDRRQFPTAGDARIGPTRDLLAEGLARYPRDVRLRFDYAEVLVKMLRFAEGKRVLEEVLAEAPNHPAAEEGFWRLAEACGHLGDHPCEKRAYTEVLRRWTEEHRRATPLLNLAETEMHLGNLRDAVEAYRECIRVSARVGARETSMLGQWGLAVALDRAGDGVAALREATFAAELERSSGVPRYARHVVSSLLRSSGVYFVPDYEVTWYEGLGAMALARKAQNDDDALAFFQKAQQSFSAYVRGAEADRSGLERWLPIARNRLASATAEVRRLEKRLQAKPSATEEE